MWLRAVLKTGVVGRTYRFGAARALVVPLVLCPPPIEIRITRQHHHPSSKAYRCMTHGRGADARCESATRFNSVGSLRNGIRGPGVIGGVGRAVTVCMDVVCSSAASITPEPEASTETSGRGGLHVHDALPPAQVGRTHPVDSVCALAVAAVLSRIETLLFTCDTATPMARDPPACVFPSTCVPLSGCGA